MEYNEIHVKSKAVVDIPDKLNVQQLNYDNDEDKVSYVYSSFPEYQCELHLTQKVISD